MYYYITSHDIGETSANSLCKDGQSKEIACKKGVYIPSTLPNKCAVKLCTCSSILGLLYQLPFLNGTSNQTPYPMKADAVKLLFFFIFAWYHSDNILLKEMFCNKFINIRLEVLFPLMRRQLQESVFQLFEVLPGLCLPLSHACSASGIHGS